MKIEHSYEPGEEVEVMLKDPGFENSFFEAKVVSKEGPSSYKVRYETLRTDDYSEPLEEVLPSEELRPKPPHVPVSCFSLYELADVYEDDGWWAGIIYGKFKDDYFLYHPVTKEERPYRLESLRAHHEWRDGGWICHKARADGSNVVLPAV